MPRIAFAVLLLMLCPVLAACGLIGGLTPCPALAVFRGVTLTVAADFAPRVASLTLRACQHGACTARKLDLTAGTTALSSSCQAGREEPCSVVPTPDGTLVGNLDLPGLTEDPLQIRLTGTDKAGSALEARELVLHPSITRPFGPDCPAGGPQARLRLDAGHLSEQP